MNALNRMMIAALMSGVFALTAIPTARAAGTPATQPATAASISAEIASLQSENESLKPDDPRRSEIALQIFALKQKLKTMPAAGVVHDETTQPTAGEAPSKMESPGDAVSSKRARMIAELDERMRKIAAFKQPYIDQVRRDLTSEQKALAVARKGRGPIASDDASVKELEKKLAEMTSSLHASQALLMETRSDVTQMTDAQVKHARAPYGGVSDDDIAKAKQAQEKIFDDQLAESSQHKDWTPAQKAGWAKDIADQKAEVNKQMGKLDWALAVFVGREMKDNAPLSGRVFDTPNGHTVSGVEMDKSAAADRFNSIWRSWRAKKPAAETPAEGDTPASSRRAR